MKVFLDKWTYDLISLRIAGYKLNRSTCCRTCQSLEYTNTVCLSILICIVPLQEVDYAWFPHTSSTSEPLLIFLRTIYSIPGRKTNFLLSPSPGVHGTFCVMLTQLTQEPRGHEGLPDCGVCY